MSSGSEVSVFRIAFMRATPRRPGLVREHVIRHADQDSDYCRRSMQGVVAKELKERGFDVTSGWKVETPGGEVLKGDNICRTALLAVWLEESRIGSWPLPLDPGPIRL